jgi:hypothetical protein
MVLCILSATTDFKQTASTRPGESQEVRERIHETGSHREDRVPRSAGSEVRSDSSRLEPSTDDTACIQRIATLPLYRAMQSQKPREECVHAMIQPSDKTVDTKFSIAAHSADITIETA